MNSRQPQTGNYLSTLLGSGATPFGQISPYRRYSNRDSLEGLSSTSPFGGQERESSRDSLRVEESLSAIEMRDQGMEKIVSSESMAGASSSPRTNRTDSAEVTAAPPRDGLDNQAPGHGETFDRSHGHMSNAEPLHDDGESRATPGVVPASSHGPSVTRSAEVPGSRGEVRPVAPATSAHRSQSFNEPSDRTQEQAAAERNNPEAPHESLPYRTSDGTARLVLRHEVISQPRVGSNSAFNSLPDSERSLAPRAITASPLRESTNESTTLDKLSAPELVDVTDSIPTGAARLDAGGTSDGKPDRQVS